LAASTCPLCSPHPSETIPSNSFTPICQRTEDKLTESFGFKVTNTQLSPGALVAPSLVSPVLVVQVPQDLVKVLSVTCAVKVACSPHLRHGESGTERSTSLKRDTPSLQLSPHQLLPHLFSPEVTTSIVFPELPLVIDNLNLEKTSGLLTTLNKIGAEGDLHRVRSTKTSRAGQNKMRYSRFILRKGPLIVYGDENPLLKRTARNLPGVDTCSVHRLNLLQLAPGGHLGRFVIFTKDAFTHLNHVFGTYR
jgi:hypothetical protein